MKQQIVDPLALTENQQRLLELHSVLNVLGVIKGRLELTRLLLDDERFFVPGLRLITELYESLSEYADVDALGNAYRQCRQQIEADLVSAWNAISHSEQQAEIISELGDALRRVFQVTEERLAELKEREQLKDSWAPHSITQLEHNIRTVFAVIARNSNGLFGISFDPKTQGPNDYLMVLDFDGLDGAHIIMPPVIQDCFRDLLANARKYTPVGGRIHGSLQDDGRQLRMVVRDTGRGIPETEIQKVVQFGGRASNTSSQETRGGGYGLTKAYSVCHRFGGQFWIDSCVDVGTTVTLAISRPR